MRFFDNGDKFNNQVSMQNDNSDIPDGVDDYEEEVVINNVYEDNPEYEEEYYDDGQYYEEEPYDDTNAAAVYDDRMQKILDELAELKKNVKQQPHGGGVPPVMPHNYGFNNGQMYMPYNNDMILNELSRLRDENSRVQAQQELNTQINRMKEDFQRDLANIGASKKLSNDAINLINAKYSKDESGDAVAKELMRLREKIARMEEEKNGGYDEQYDRPGKKQSFNEFRKENSGALSKVSNISKKITKVNSQLNDLQNIGSGSIGDILRSLKDDINNVAAITNDIAANGITRMLTVTGEDGTTQVLGLDSQELLTKVRDITSLLGTFGGKTAKLSSQMTDVRRAIGLSAICIRDIEGNISFKPLEDKMLEMRYLSASQTAPSHAKAAVMIAVNNMLKELPLGEREDIITEFITLSNAILATEVNRRDAKLLTVEAVQPTKTALVERFYELCDSLEDAEAVDYLNIVRQIVDIKNRIQEDTETETNAAIETEINTAFQDLMLADPANHAIADANLSYNIGELSALLIGDIVKLEDFQSVRPETIDSVFGLADKIDAIKDLVADKSDSENILLAVHDTIPAIIEKVGEVESKLETFISDPNRNYDVLFELSAMKDQIQALVNPAFETTVMTDLADLREILSNNLTLDEQRQLADDAAVIHECINEIMALRDQFELQSSLMQDAAIVEDIANLNTRLDLLDNLDVQMTRFGVTLDSLKNELVSAVTEPSTQIINDLALFKEEILSYLDQIQPILNEELEAVRNEVTASSNSVNAANAEKIDELANKLNDIDDKISIVNASLTTEFAEQISMLQTELSMLNGSVGPELSEQIIAIKEEVVKLAELMNQDMTDNVRGIREDLNTLVSSTTDLETLTELLALREEITNYINRESAQAIPDEVYALREEIVALTEIINSNPLFAEFAELKERMESDGSKQKLDDIVEHLNTLKQKSEEDTSDIKLEVISHDLESVIQKLEENANDPRLSILAEDLEAVKQRLEDDSNAQKLDIISETIEDLKAHIEEHNNTIIAQANENAAVNFENVMSFLQYHSENLEWLVANTQETEQAANILEIKEHVDNLVSGLTGVTATLEDINVIKEQLDALNGQTTAGTDDLYAKLEEVKEELTNFANRKTDAVLLNELYKIQDKLDRASADEQAEKAESQEIQNDLTVRTSSLIFEEINEIKAKLDSKEYGVDPEITAQLTSIKEQLSGLLKNAEAQKEANDNIAVQKSAEESAYIQQMIADITAIKDSLAVSDDLHAANRDILTAEIQALKETGAEGDNYILSELNELKTVKDAVDLVTAEIQSLKDVGTESDNYIIQEINELKTVKDSIDLVTAEIQSLKDTGAESDNYIIQELNELKTVKEAVDLVTAEIQSLKDTGAESDNYIIQELNELKTALETGDAILEQLQALRAEKEDADNLVLSEIIALKSQLKDLSGKPMKKVSEETAVNAETVETADTENAESGESSENVDSSSEEQVSESVQFTKLAKVEKSVKNIETQIAGIKEEIDKNINQYALSMLIEEVGKIKKEIESRETVNEDTLELFKQIKERLENAPDSVVKAENREQAESSENVESAQTGDKAEALDAINSIKEYLDSKMEPDYDLVAEIVSLKEEIRLDREDLNERLKAEFNAFKEELKSTKLDIGEEALEDDPFVKDIKSIKETTAANANAIKLLSENISVTKGEIDPAIVSEIHVLKEFFAESHISDKIQNLNDEIIALRLEQQTKNELAYAAQNVSESSNEGFFANRELISRIDLLDKNFSEQASNIGVEMEDLLTEINLLRQKLAGGTSLKEESENETQVKEEKSAAVAEQLLLKLDEIKNEYSDLLEARLYEIKTEIDESKQYSSIIAEQTQDINSIVITDSEKIDVLVGALNNLKEDLSAGRQSNSEETDSLKDLIDERVEVINATVDKLAASLENAIKYEINDSISEIGRVERELKETLNVLKSELFVKAGEIDPEILEEIRGLREGLQNTEKAVNNEKLVEQLDVNTVNIRESADRMAAFNEIIAEDLRKITDAIEAIDNSIAATAENQAFIQALNDLKNDLITNKADSDNHLVVEVGTLREQLFAIYDTVNETLTAYKENKASGDILDKIGETAEVLSSIDFKLNEVEQFKHRFDELFTEVQGFKAYQIQSEELNVNAINNLIDVVNEIRGNYAEHFERSNENAENFTAHFERANENAENFTAHFEHANENAENLAAHLDEIKNLTLEQSNQISLINDRLNEAAESGDRNAAVIQQSADTLNANTDALNSMVVEIQNFKVNQDVLEQNLLGKLNELDDIKELVAQSVDSINKELLENIYSEIKQIGENTAQNDQYATGEMLANLAEIKANQDRPVITDDSLVIELLAEVRAVKLQSDEQREADAQLINELLAEIRELKEHAAKPVEQDNTLVEELLAEVRELKEHATKPVEQDNTVIEELLAEVRELKEHATKPVEQDNTVIEELLAEVRELKEHATKPVEQDNAMVEELLAEIRELKEQATKPIEQDNTMVEELLAEIRELKEQATKPVEQDNALVEELLAEIRQLKEQAVTNGGDYKIDELKQRVEEMTQQFAVPFEQDNILVNELVDEVRSLKDAVASKPAEISAAEDIKKLYEAVESLGKELREIAQKQAADGTAENSLMTGELIAEIGARNNSISDKIVEELVKMKYEIHNELTNQHEKEKATISMIQEMSNMFERQRDLSNSEFSAQILSEINKLQNDFDSRLTATIKPIDESAIINEISKLKEELSLTAAEPVVIDNAQIIEELAKLKEELSKEKPSEFNKQLMEEISRIKDDITAIGSKEIFGKHDESKKISDSLSELKLELSQIAGIVDDNKAIKPKTTPKKKSEPKQVEKTEPEVKQPLIVKASQDVKARPTGAKTEKAKQKPTSQIADAAKEAAKALERVTAQQSAQPKNKPEPKKPEPKKQEQIKPEPVKAVEEIKSKPAEAVKAEVKKPAEQKAVIPQEPQKVEKAPEPQKAAATQKPKAPAKAKKPQGTIKSVPFNDELTEIDELNLADQLAKQVANKLIMEQLVQQLGDGGVPQDRIDELVGSILPKDVKENDAFDSDSVKRIANQLVLDKLRASLKNKK